MPLKLSHCSLGLARCIGHRQFRFWIVDGPYRKKADSIVRSVAYSRKRTQDPVKSPSGDSEEKLGWEWKEKWSLSQKNNFLVWRLSTGSFWVTSTNRIWKEVWKNCWRLVWACSRRTHFKVKIPLFFVVTMPHILQEKHFKASWDYFSLIEHLTVHYWLCKMSILVAILEIFQRQEGK